MSDHELHEFEKQLDKTYGPIRKVELGIQQRRKSLASETFEYDMGAAWREALDGFMPLFRSMLDDALELDPPRQYDYWLLIESAPKGIAVLVYENGFVRQATQNSRDWLSDGCTVEPSHWMPLPAGPEVV